MFSDRLVDENDKESFITLISDKLGTLFDLTFHNLCPNKQPPIFGELAQFSLDYRDRTTLNRSINYCMNIENLQ